MSAVTYQGISTNALPGLHEQGLELLRKYVPSRCRVLDLGTGAGAFMQRLLDADFQVVGVDLQEEDFRAKGTFIRHDLNAPFAGALAQPEGFDAAVAIEVVEHLENPRHLFRECAALLKPGGVLLLSTPYIESTFSRIKFLVTGRFEWFEEGHYHSSGHVTPITQWQLRQIAHETGYEVVETRKGPRPIVSWRRRTVALVLSFLMSGASPEGNRLSVFRRTDT